jgi:high-affinity iron transporter
MSGLMLQLSVGLFTMGCNEFEIVWGMTVTVYEIEGDFWYDKSLPMTILRPFGYSSTRTVLQICCFWIWMAFGLFLHYIKWRNTKIATLREENEQEVITAEPPQSGSDSGGEDQESDLVNVVVDV